MTIQPAEAPAIDIAEMVGEMPEVPCESTTHGKVLLHPDAGNATHYALVTCLRCRKRETKAYCLAMVHVVQDNLYIHCSQCRNKAPAQAVITILGPVKS